MYTNIYTHTHKKHIHIYAHIYYIHTHIHRSKWKETQAQVKNGIKRERKSKKDIIYYTKINKRTQKEIHTGKRQRYREKKNEKENKKNRNTYLHA